MRRSSAPSIKKKLVCNIETKKAINNEKISSNWLLSNNENKKKINVTETNNIIPQVCCDDGKIFYNVVWGKMSTKKHKTYQDDGILIISDKLLTLTDLSGKLLGTSFLEKDDGILEVGSQICVGSKDVELIEKILPAEKRLLENVTETRPTKKFKNQLFSSNIENLNSKNILSSSNVKQEFKSTNKHTTNITKSQSLVNKTEKILQNLNDDEIFYNVVWGKMSTKKHKTYQDEGKLIISDRLLTLTDLSGKLLGSSFLEKNDTILEEGSQICIGNKDVELIEKISTLKSDTVKNITKTESKNNLLKQTQFRAPTINDNIEKKIVKKDFEPLKMPDPSYEHQLKYNLLKSPLNSVYVIDILSSVLRPHQREGVIFLYECLMGFRSTEKGDGDHFGAILADEMSLGKTLQCITVCYTLLKQEPYGTTFNKRILIVTPSSLVDNWDAEISKWLKNERILTYVIDVKHTPEQFSSKNRIPFMICSYEMFSNHFETIKTIKFDIIVCDEGHRLKNSQIKVAILLNQIECKRRIILTGTPIQNDLHEFYTLINFVNPGILSTYTDYKIYFETPIVNSQQPDIDDDVKELGEERASELNKIINAFVLRRTQDVINVFLPEKQECIIFCRPQELQQKLIEKILDYYENKLNYNIKVTSFEIITLLKKVCNHPSLIRKNSNELNEKSILMKLQDDLPEWNKMGPYDSGKLFTIDCLLSDIYEKKERVVVVSYYTKTLDIIMNLANHCNYKYCRLDGTTPSSDRMNIVNKFNHTDSDIFIFLLSAKAGGIGLNLIGASRLILYDNDWNPASDLQAISRIWREGQKKNVVIYRLITAGTIEEKIFQRQISKTSLGGCVVQTQNSNNLKLSDEELKDIFTVQHEFETCLTHELIECDCSGIGEIPIKHSELYEESLLDNVVPTSLKIHELFKWEHHKPPINKSVLEDLCLTNAESDLIYIFRNQSEL